MEHFTLTNIRAYVAVTGLLLTSSAAMSVTVDPPGQDGQVPSLEWPFGAESVLENDWASTRSEQDPPSEPASSTVVLPTETDCTSDFLQTEVIQCCEQKIQSTALRALRSRANILLTRKAVPDPDAWSSAVAHALCANGMPLTPQYFSLIFTFIEKESGFVAHGLLPRQPNAFRKIAYKLIDDFFRSDPRIIKRLVGTGRAAEYVPVILDLLQEIGIANPTIAKRKLDRYYRDYNWKRIRTEWDIEHQLIDDIYQIAGSNTAVGLVLRTLLKLKPEIDERLRQRLIFRTIGPMQVSISHAQQLAEENGETYSDEQMKDILYTIRGGVYFGTHRLKELVGIYTGHFELDATAAGFIAVDYTGGKRLARDQALVDQISRVTGVKFPTHATLSWSQVEHQLRVLAEQMLASNGACHREETVQGIMRKFKKDLLGQEIEQNALYRYIKGRYRAGAKKEPVFAAVPKICLRPYKGGRYCLSDIANNAIETFKENCRVLKCR